MAGRSGRGGNGSCSQSQSEKWQLLSRWKQQGQRQPAVQKPQAKPRGWEGRSNMSSVRAKRKEEGAEGRRRRKRDKQRPNLLVDR